MAQVAIIGASPRALTTWQLLLALGILWHHSNVGLPRRVDRALAWAVVTPRMHGIHHSEREEERNANWSSAVLSVWDRLHGTLRQDVPQQALCIGLPAPDTHPPGRPRARGLARLRPAAG
jgi:sterol desaturase/sphingolipid hydroxylase (fatty acid hydroxylase superfamily)